MEDLFKNFENDQGIQVETKTCLTCGHRLRKAYRSGKAFHYCKVISSGRTDNGLLKIKCKQRACVRHTENK